MEATNPILEKLGLQPADRAVIFHADDVGMTHGANIAFLELAQHGLVTCGSVMTPCPWFPEIAMLASTRPHLDLGVHLTLTSEWDRYRWGPISTRDPASGLIDDEGYFWRRPEQVREHLRIEVVEAEFRAQIDRALAAGIDVTHLDTHMGVAALPELVELYVRLGLEYRLPILMVRRMDSYMESLNLGPGQAERVTALPAELEHQGMPLLDTFRISVMTPSDEGNSDEINQVYYHMIAELPPGITYFSLHPDVLGEIETMARERSLFRIREYRLLQNLAFMTFVTEQQIHRLGYRQLRDLMRA
ncbi:MAG: polysaccharide deacetylase family protein [Chloroflexales bacterium]|nr:polysaccharide deacetylase family protein [Chloroflexales bacterium]